MEIYVRVLVRSNSARRQERNINVAPERVHIFPYPTVIVHVTLRYFSKDCGSVPTISHGRYSLVSANETTFGAEADVICDAGYNANDIVVTCLGNGTWATVACYPSGTVDY